MDAKEVRMRCIEAVSTMGIREPARLIQDAAKIEEWVNAAQSDDAGAVRGYRRADKAQAPA